ncbi:MAG: ion transporter, partial [Pseudomonadales bacterium]|nr:ion transporter [Pseudomonadales bacterium]MDP4912276.1 ion transporter [Pseudomonadales bacterium]MDP5058518.1 ion transporter [Pseudomonadales bacterium]
MGLNAARRKTAQQNARKISTLFSQPSQLSQLSQSAVAKQLVLFYYRWQRVDRRTKTDIGRRAAASISGGFRIMINQQRVMEILNKGNNNDQWSLMCDRFLATLIIINLLGICLESVQSVRDQYDTQLMYLEIISVSIFSLEYALRLWSSASNTELKGSTASQRRFSYATSFTGLIDLIAILPSIMGLFANNLDLRWLRTLRLIRLLKLSHYSTALEDLFSAVYQERRSFFAAMYIMAIALFMASALMYLAENAAQPEKFSSIPQTMWWAVVTLTTVGYGDVTPITPLGQIIGALTAISGICAAALLTGIVASAFANQMARRQAIFEAEVTTALQDGEISKDEAGTIELLRNEFKITEEHALAIIQLAKENYDL